MAEEPRLHVLERQRVANRAIHVRQGAGGRSFQIGKQIDEGAQKAKEKAEGAGKRVEKAVDDLTK